MKKIEYYINILHYVLYKFCDKNKKILPGFSPDINAGRILGILSLLFGFVIFMLIKRISYPKEIVTEYLFAFLIPFWVLIYFTTLYKEKYLTYFKKFDKEPKVVKCKWAKISLTLVIGIILLLIISFS